MVALTTNPEEIVQGNLSRGREPSRRIAQGKKNFLKSLVATLRETQWEQSRGRLRFRHCHRRGPGHVAVWNRVRASVLNRDSQTLQQPLELQAIGEHKVTILWKSRGGVLRGALVQ